VLIQLPVVIDFHKIMQVTTMRSPETCFESNQQFQRVAYVTFDQKCAN